MSAPSIHMSFYMSKFECWSFKNHKQKKLEHKRGNEKDNMYGSLM